MNQHEIWNQEHLTPSVLPQMDRSNPSLGVTKFIDWAQNNLIELKTGLEIGCGKGRNCIWLASQGFDVTGFDFAENAITEAKKRLQKENSLLVPKFKIHDLTTPWNIESESLDFIIDCFASTDIDSEKGRAFARKEVFRTLKPGGYLLLYTLSTEDEFHAKMIQENPADQPHSFYHSSTGKFEKVFEEDEIKDLYSDFEIIVQERIVKTDSFQGVDYNCRHFWFILQKS